jgi:DDE family transposase
MFKDEQRHDVWEHIRQRDFKQFFRLLSPSLIGQAAADAGAAMGQGTLNLGTLTWLTLSSALHTTLDFASVLTFVLKLMADAQVPLPEPKPVAKKKKTSRSKKKGAKGDTKRSKHDPYGSSDEVSEEAFTQARRKMPAGFWIALILLLGKAFEKEHAELTLYQGLRLLALDGTCINLSMWSRLKNYFGTARNGKGPRTVQARMVMLQLPLVRLPLGYELTPLKEGERTVAARVLRHVRAEDLVLMDKGFWSYGLFRQIQGQQAFFAVRLMRGIKFKTLRRLGHKDRLVTWKPAARQWKTEQDPSPSIELRVIDYQVKGFRPSAIVTNMNDPRRLSREQWLGLARSDAAGPRLDEGLYHQRWQIETTFCELKVRQEMEGHLRGRTPETIAYEVAGHVLLYMLTRWLMVEAALEHGKEPLRLSYLGAWREWQGMRQTLLTSDAERVRRVLLPRLLKRIASHHVPLRPGRHYPRPGDTKVKHNGAGGRMLPSKLSK